jgi:prevent-host-death family protein
MHSFKLTDAKAHFSELVRRAELGEETIITRHGLPVARLVPIAPPKKAYRSLADFRAAFPKARTSAVTVVRRQRDEGY